MANDYTFVKGFRTGAAYFVESAFGTFAVDQTHARKVGGKVRSVNWQARQNIIQTGSVGDGSNYKQQLFGNYDASASMQWEVGDFSFLRFGVGDIAQWNTSGAAETTPYFLVEAELCGIDNGGETALSASVSDSSVYSTVRIRPFSLLLFDVEGAAGSATWNSNIDMLTGCMISDFSLSAAVNTPLTCNTNIIVREVQYRRFLEAANTPDWTSATAVATDYGNGENSVLTPATSSSRAQDPPLMFYNGGVYIQGSSVNLDGSNKSTTYKLGQVTSFNYSWNNQFQVYREANDRMITMPQKGIRRQSFNCNLVFRLPPGSDGSPTAGTTGAFGSTSILEIVKNYLGYGSSASFTTGATLRPALATSSASTSPQTSVPVEKTAIELYFLGPWTDQAGSAHTKGAKIMIRNAAIEGFGLPLQLESGLIEIPINFSVRGYPYTKVSDGSYLGHDGSGTTLTDYNPTFSWWYS